MSAQYPPSAPAFPHATTGITVPSGAPLPRTGGSDMALTYGGAGAFTLGLALVLASLFGRRRR